MKKLNAILASIALVLFLFAAWFNSATQVEHRARMNYIKEQHYQENLARYEGVRVLFAYGLAVIVLTGLAVGIRVFYIRLGDKALLSHFRGLEASQAMTVAYYEAHKQPNHRIKNLTYSPTINSQNASQKQSREVTPEISDNPTSTTLKALPSLSEILQNSPHNHVCYGFTDDNEPHYVALKQLSSLGVGGLSGSGKSSTLLFLLSQMTLNLNAQLIVLDPHGEHEDSLLAKLQPLKSSIITSATTTKDYLKALDVWSDLFNQRKKNAISYPVVLVCDEYLALMRDAQVKESLTNIAESLAQEGRKYQFYGYFASQKWLSTRTGDLKDTLSSHLIHRMPSSLAHYQTNLSTSELPIDVHALSQGSFYLLDNTGNIKRLRAPYVSASELLSVVPMPVVPTPMIAPVVMPTPMKPALSDDEQKIVDMFKDNKNISEIVREVYKVDGGKAYQTRSNEIQGLIRQLV